MAANIIQLYLLCEAVDIPRSYWWCLGLGFALELALTVISGFVFEGEKDFVFFIRVLAAFFSWILGMCMCVCVCVCMYVYVCMYVCMYVCSCCIHNAESG